MNRYCNYLLSNRRYRHRVKCRYDITFHIVKRCRTRLVAIVPFCCAPILLDEVELTVVLRIKIADVAAFFDHLLEKWLLARKIRLPIE